MFGSSAACLGLDQVEEIADALVTLQESEFGRLDGSPPVLVGQFLDARGGEGIEPKSE